MREFDFRREGSLKKFREYYTELIAAREEGVIIKPFLSIYEPGRDGGWLKLKKDYIEGIGDTADFAIIGGRLSEKTTTKFTSGGISFAVRYSVTLVFRKPPRRHHH